MQNLEEHVKELINKNRFKRHSDICKALTAAGHHANQSSVSRALHKIGAIKSVNDMGETYYRIRPQATKYLAINLVERIVTTETLVIIFVSSGAAGHVAEFIDRARLPTVAGTMGGDNMIFVAPYRVKDIHVIEETLRSMFL